MQKKKIKSDRGGSVDIGQTIIPGCLIIPLIALLHHPLSCALRLSSPVHSFHTLIIIIINRCFLHMKYSSLLGSQP